MTGNSKWQYKELQTSTLLTVLNLSAQYLQLNLGLHSCPLSTVVHQYGLSEDSLARRLETNGVHPCPVVRDVH